MSYQKHRDEFVAELGTSFHSAAIRLLRLSTKAHRLSELQCSGGYPFEYDGANQKKLKPCKGCESLTFKDAINGAGYCPACRTDQLAQEVAKEFGIVVQVQGDPRGWPFTVTLPDGRQLGVPCRPSNIKW